MPLNVVNPLEVTDQLTRPAEQYLKNVIAEAAGLKFASVESRAAFSELGIDSFRVLKIVRRLEDDFGTLPKTLLFENFTVSDLARYFVSKHPEVLRTKTGAERLTPMPPPAERREPPKSEVVRSKALLMLEKEALADREIGALLGELFDRYKNEAGASRGARDIAPYVFIGSARRGYANYGRCKDVVLSYAYTGPEDYFQEFVQEMHEHCRQSGLQLNFFTDRPIEVVGDHRFSSTPFGVLQRIVGLQQFTLEGGAMRRLRHQVTKFEKAGACKTGEYVCGTDPQTDRSIADLIDQWCAGKTMVNPLIHTVKREISEGLLDRRHRVFLTRVNEVLQNAILISPLSSQHSGYLMDLEFYGKDMPLGGLEYAIVKIVETLAAEGCAMLSLGGTYGCRIESCANSDPAIDKVLEELHQQNIFNDDGNLQFKNKFRPENRTIFLCRPVQDNRPQNIIDIIMMIADPVGTQTRDDRATGAATEEQRIGRPEHGAPAPAASAAAGVEDDDRAAALRRAGFNPLNIPAELVEIDLRTDSWAQLKMPAIDAQMKLLRSQLQRGLNVEQGLRAVFPFAHMVLTTSGYAAEDLFYRAWLNKGEVVQNLLFPSGLYHQIDKHFTPVELPCAEALEPDSPEIFKGNLSLRTLEEKLASGRGEVALVCIEVACNAAGGLPVSLRHLKELRRILTKHAVPLVIDATRVVENAFFSREHEPEMAGRDIWSVVREILSQADVVVCSLTKDFCVERGGLIATNDAALFARINDVAAASDGRLDAISRKLVGVAFEDRRRMEAQVSRRISSVRLIWEALKERGVPVVGPPGGHCVLIDMKAVPELKDVELPTASFLAWLYLQTGIAAGAHSVGMQKGTQINGLVRLAIPVGIRGAQVEEIIRRTTELFARKTDIPRLALEGAARGLLLDVHARYVCGEHRSTASGASRPVADPMPQSVSPEVPRVTSPLPVAVAKSSRQPYETCDIAVIGMAGRYPQAESPWELWRNIARGQDSIGEMPAQRRERGQHPGNTGLRGGFLDAVDRFDSLFFNISPREAELLDPQERLFLEVAWEALEDAGHYPETLVSADGPRNVGVFVGAVWAMYQMQGIDAPRAEREMSPNSFFWSIANRVSYFMNFRGPSLTVDTACSSSLTALYLACESIYKGECAAAIVGGVNIDLHRRKMEINGGSGALSVDGVCRSFGKGGNGYVAGEGVGAVVVKPLERALRDGDNIQGIIKGVCVNHGGRSGGYTVPNPKAQTELISAALERAGVDPRTVGYIEAHGTGTELGDPIEIASLVGAFDKHSVEKNSCAIGSIKTNIGHLEAAAGLVGMCKVLLQMRHRMLAPSLHSTELNPFIDFGNSPFYVVQRLERWSPKHLHGVTTPLRAGVSSFGAGGSNAHVVLESYEPVVLDPQDEEFEQFSLPLSAKTEEQLRQQAARLRDYLRQLPVDTAQAASYTLRNISHTLRFGRKSFDCRLVVLAATRAELLDRLDGFVQGKSDANVLTGSTKSGELLARMLSKNEQSEFAAMLGRTRDPRTLAQSWVDGLLADWSVMREASTGRKVSLPTYPFADRRHWFSREKSVVAPSAPARGLHPLIDSNESTFERQLFKKTFRADDFFIADHCVAGVPTLPGVAYLEFARKAAETAAGRKVRRIRNVLWLSPVTVKDSIPSAVFIELIPGADNVRFEVFSEGASGTKTLHSQGSIVYATEQDEQAGPEYIDLPGIRAESRKVLDGKDAYPVFNSLGLALGPSFQVLGEIFAGAGGTLGALTLPTCRQGDLTTLLLHPSLVDGSLQALVAGRLSDPSGEMVVPYSIGEVEILQPLQAECWSYVTVPADANALGSRVSKANVVVVDRDGKVLIRIRETTGVPLREVNKTTPSVASAKSAPVHYYTYDWVKAGPPAGLPPDRAANQPNCVLFLEEHGTLCDLYETRRRQGAAAGGPGVWVQAGAGFEQTGAHSFRVDPRSAEDFGKLFIALHSKELRPGEVCITGSPAGRGTADDAAVFPLLSLSKALMAHQPDLAVRVVYAFQSAANENQPHHEAIAGYAKALQIESPKITCRTLEMRHSTVAPGELLDAVFAEMRADDRGTEAVRYDQGERHVKRFRELDLRSAPARASSVGIGVKEGGFYIVTGAGGGLGLIFAEFLAREFHARLLLIGRSELDARRRARLDELSTGGAQIEYCRADVTDREQIQAAVEQGRMRFGAINGVIHAAGVVRDSLIRNKTLEDLQAVLAPKVKGTLLLDEATAAEELDFFVMFSSLSSVGGNAGQCDYCYANHFMDSFASKREAMRLEGTRRGRTVSINWSLWADGGMRLDEQTERMFRKATGLEPLETQPGLEAFSRALAADQSQVVVVAGDSSMLELAWGVRQPEARVTPTAGAATAAAADGDAGLEALVIEELSTIAMEFLKLEADDISIDKILLDLGFDSIGLATYANKINERYLLEITPILFFDYASIGEVAKHLVKDKRAEILNVHSAHQDTAAARAAAPAAPAATSRLEEPAPAVRLRKGMNRESKSADASRPHSLTRSDPGMRFRNEPIAIVGVGGVMPQSEDLGEFWEHLRDGDDLVTVVPEERWRWQDYFGDPMKEANKTHSKWGAFMKEVDKFDAQFFGISAREAHMMDPQQRIFLQTVWQAIEDSGHKVSDLSGSKTGLFVGVATNDYVNLINRLHIDIDAFTASGNAHSVLANRISFLLNLHGPSSPIDTGCSSSLVALHRAIESIHTGSCDMAIVGGVAVMLTAAAHIAFSKAGRLSSDGKCRTFDKRGTGYVRGEGAGAILIKPLSSARADGDHIYAVIKATAENHGGRVTMLTAPNAAAQTELLVDAYGKAGIDPATVGYIECHGTGSTLGDSIEVQALTNAFSQLYARHGLPAAGAPHCGLSSLKSNIGHLETASGIAGIIKIVMALEHQQIPGTLHLEELNPYIHLEKTPFYIVDKTVPWRSPRGADGTVLPRRAGISSFGFGGANAHIVLEENIAARSQPRPADQPPRLLVLSAKSADRLKAYARSLLHHLESRDVDMESLTYTLQVGRDAFPHRFACIVRDGRDAMAKLASFLALPTERTTVGKAREAAGQQAASAAQQAAIVALMAAGDLLGAAESWMAGATVDWSACYGENPPQRIPLPTYPFGKDRYWLPDTIAPPVEIAKSRNAMNDESRVHPLKQRLAGELQP